ncbi:MAG: sigma-54-dependent Fis family transcriptional regulator, partial [Alphaproteobacteria bacterium]|nr:sigma-54-dependent Fis family transcriptional regulator [Alphaproteobacteria bacterium]
RAAMPIISLSAARMAPERIEEELFGVDDAVGSRPGMLELAHGGTLFLDEVADMPLPTQAKILRVLTDQRFTRIGGQQMVEVDVRVVSATSRNLTEEIAAGRFREDLFYRLNVVPVHIPELARRRDDIAALASQFAARFARERCALPPQFTASALASLQSYDWPGNVRQLRNIIERTLILAPTDRLGEIDIDMLPRELFQTDGDSPAVVADSPAMMGVPLREAREEFEREYLRVQIRRFAGNISRTASFVGMERSALHRKMKSLGLMDERSTAE